MFRTSFFFSLSNDKYNIYGKGQKKFKIQLNTRRFMGNFGHALSRGFCKIVNDPLKLGHNPHIWEIT
jgi:hypothetical protein